MSVPYLLLFFLCISLHAYCSASRLSTLDKKLEKKPHLSIKTEKINGFESYPNHFPVMNEGKRMKTWFVTQMPRKERRTNQKVLKVTRKDSAASQTKSLVSVSWRVPHKKPSEKNPGFNLDYSPPKTHPPSHN